MTVVFSVSPWVYR